MDSPDFVVVQYPGIVNNMDKALVTLGGMHKLSQDYFKGANLALNFHPENFYSKSTISHRKSVIFVVLKARRKKGSSSVFDVSSLGVATALYQFNHVFDFQYLPVKRIMDPDTATTSEEAGKQNRKCPEAAKFENLLPKMYPMDIESCIKWFEEKTESQDVETELLILPNTFSKFYSNTPYILGRETVPMAPPAQELPMGSRSRAQRMSYAVSVSEGEAPPTKANPTGLQKAMNFASQELKDLFKQVMEERPVWTRGSLAFRTKLDDTTIRCVIPAYAYYMISGPYSRTWCKYGCDTRSDPHLRPYQIFVYSRRGWLPATPKRRQAIGEKPRIFHHDVVNPNIHEYQQGKIPMFRQMFYQLCDIHLPVVQQMLSEPVAVETYSSTYGWLTAEQIELIKIAIKEDIDNTIKLHPELEDIEMQEAGAEDDDEP